MRLWYENQGVFSPSQRNVLRTASLARIICDNTGISSVPRDPFSLLSGRNRLALPTIEAERTRLSQAEQDILGRMESKMEEDNEVTQVA
ncbi:unnamed protein product [Boreogadus saida]